MSDEVKTAGGGGTAATIVGVLLAAGVAGAGALYWKAQQPAPIPETPLGSAASMPMTRAALNGGGVETDSSGAPAAALSPGGGGVPDQIEGPEGHTGEGPGPLESPAPVAEAEARAAASSDPAAPRLRASAHLEVEGGSSASATVQNRLETKETRGRETAPRATAKRAPKESPLAASSAAREGASIAAASDFQYSQYGTSRRSDIMINDSGPVNNVKRKKAAGAPAAGPSRELETQASEAEKTVADIRKNLENLSLPPEQKAALKRELEQAVRNEGETGN